MERGLFDALFLADILGVYDVYGGNADAALRNAVEFPVNDPFLLAPAMAMVTRHLGFGITGTVCYEAPFSFARRLSTLDHLTNGRIGWNIVTGYLDSAAKAFGQARQLVHDERYDLAEEFMQVVYGLWEGSWEEDAVRRDKRSGIFACPERIHKVRHEGRYFRMEGYHLCEPSPQRTPFLFQAGASAKGRRFAARHAECVFLCPRTVRAAADAVRDVREQALAMGRDPASLLVQSAMTVITRPTDAEAQAAVADYQHYVRPEGALALLSGYLGIDFADHSLDAALDGRQITAIQSCVDGFAASDPYRRWTLRDAIEQFGVAAYKPMLVGSPKTVTDGLIGWMEQTDLDGFNIEYIVSPGDFRAFVDLAVPELQRRGVYKTCYQEGTLREKLNRRGSRLPSTHPAAAYRPGIGTQPQL